MNKYILINLYNKMLLKNKNKLLIRMTMWVFLKKYYLGQKEPDTKDHILNDFIYLKDKNRQKK